MGGRGSGLVGGRRDPLARQAADATSILVDIVEARREGNIARLEVAVARAVRFVKSLEE